MMALIGSVAKARNDRLRVRLDDDLVPPLDKEAKELGSTIPRRTNVIVRNYLDAKEQTKAFMQTPSQRQS